MGRNYFLQVSCSPWSTQTITSTGSERSLVLMQYLVGTASEKIYCTASLSGITRLRVLTECFNCCFFYTLLPLTILFQQFDLYFCHLIPCSGAQVEVKNKKGCSPLWLACNGGHLDVVQKLVQHGADVNSMDNRKTSCLMAAFRKGHLKVVKFLVKHVTQFPADSQCLRYIQTITDKVRK